MTTTVTLYQSTKVFLAVGIILMFVLLLMRRKKYSLSISKTIYSFISIAFCGVLGVFIMFYLENGVWGGISFFGSILIGPLLLIPFSLVLKIPFFKALSWCAPSICLVHIMSKINCYIVGCCSGNDFYNSMIPIPLQLLEGLLIFVILLILLLAEKILKNKNNVFPIYLVLYGIVRFVLNYYRKDIAVFYILPAGNFWSIISVMTGLFLVIINLYISYKKTEK